MSKQRVNSLDRFRKQPGRLVLEQHSSCEVPAGCGGVVLRWRNPLAGTPVVIYLYAPAEKVTCFLDGVQIVATRTEFPAGPHVLAVALQGADLTSGAFMFAAVHDPKACTSNPPNARTKVWALLSAADGTWKFSADAPAGGSWAAPDFDDGAWPALAQAPTPPDDWNRPGAFQIHRCTERGAACLRVSGRFAPPKGSLWIRKRFAAPPVSAD